MFRKKTQKTVLEIRERERNIDVKKKYQLAAPVPSLLRIKPATHACVLTPNRIGNLLVHGMTCNQLSYINQSARVEVLSQTGEADECSIESQILIPSTSLR